MEKKLWNKPIVKELDVGLTERGRGCRCDGRCFRKKHGHHS